MLDICSFMSFFVVGARAKTMSFNKPQKKKSSGNRSKEHGGHATGPSRPIHF